MKSIQDFSLFGNDQQIQDNKQKSIDALMKDQAIQDILQKYQFKRQDIEENWVEFLDYQEDIRQCDHCRGIKDCSKISKGMKRVFEIHDGQILLSLAPCQFGHEILENQKILSHILLKNVSDRILLTTIQDITIFHDEDSNANTIVKKLNDFMNQPTNKGFYLYGHGGTGKSTLMGLLVRGLAKKGYRCGFIHFPTFLMDLKNSFGEDGNDSSIEMMKSLDYLFIDDVGGESVTNWSRDEVLSAIIAYRLQNNKVTFFTSEYPIDKLKDIYTLKKGDKQRVERLIDRMKAVSIPLNLKGRDLR